MEHRGGQLRQPLVNMWHGCPDGAVNFHISSVIGAGVLSYIPGRLLLRRALELLLLACTSDKHESEGAGKWIHLNLLKSDLMKFSDSEEAFWFYKYWNVFFCPSDMLNSVSWITFSSSGTSFQTATQYCVIWSTLFQINTLIPAWIQEHCFRE